MPSKNELDTKSITDRFFIFPTLVHDTSTMPSRKPQAIIAFEMTSIDFYSILILFCMRFYSYFLCVYLKNYIALGYTTTPLNTLRKQLNCSFTY